MRKALVFFWEHEVVVENESVGHSLGRTLSLNGGLDCFEAGSFASLLSFDMEVAALD